MVSYYQGLPRVTIRPGVRVKRLSKSAGSSRAGSGQEIFDFSRDGSDRVKRCSKSHGSGWVGSGHPDPARPAKVAIRPVESPSDKLGGLRVIRVTRVTSTVIRETTTTTITKVTWFSCRLPTSGAAADVVPVSTGDFPTERVPGVPLGGAIGDAIGDGRGDGRGDAIGEAMGVARDGDVTPDPATTSGDRDFDVAATAVPRAVPSIVPHAGPFAGPFAAPCAAFGTRLSLPGKPPSLAVSAVAMAMKARPVVAVVAVFLEEEPPSAPHGDGAASSSVAI